MVFVISRMQVTRCFHSHAIDTFVFISNFWTSVMIVMEMYITTISAYVPKNVTYLIY